MGQESVPDTGILPRLLRRGGGGEDQPTRAREAIEEGVGRGEGTGAHWGVQHLRAHPAREATVEDADQPARRDAREPLGEGVERDGRLRQVEDVRIVGNQFVRVAAVAGEVDDHDVVLVAGGERREVLLYRNPRRLSVEQLYRAGAERVGEERVHGACVPARAIEPRNLGRSVAINPDEQTTKHHRAHLLKVSGDTTDTSPVAVSCNLTLLSNIAV